jgi:putative DNA primase/helicase
MKTETTTTGAAALNTAIIADVQKHLTAQSKLKSKGEILKSLIEQCTPVDFTAKQYPNISAEERTEIKVKRIEIKVLIIDEVLERAQANNWALCKQGGFCYLYNGAYWETLTEDDVKHFLSENF